MASQLANIILVGMAFMILLTAFQTTSLLSQSVLEGVKNETANGTSFHGSGYISMAILYTSFTLVTAFVPGVISLLGPAGAMFLGSTAYFLYVLSYIYPMTWSYYLTSVLIGFGASLIWTGQGAYLANNSDDMTVSRNCGIFWALTQFSLFFGDLYIYLSLKTDMIDHRARYSIFTILSIVAAMGLGLFLLIVWRSYRDNLRNSYTEKTNALAGVRLTLKTASRLLKTRHILLLLFPFAYLGLSPTFFAIVYATCIAHYKKYGDTRKRLIGLHGILLGAGEIIGGGVFGFLTKPRTSSQRATIVLTAFLLHLIYYYSVFLNFPTNAPAQETDTKAYLNINSTVSQVITFTGSFIVGLGDAGLNTQIMNVLASRYKQTAASAFAIFKFVQALATAIGFFYAGSLALQWQLLILVIVLFVSTLAFFSVLFDHGTSEISTFVTVQDNDYGNIGYQSSMASSFN